MPKPEEQQRAPNCATPQAHFGDIIAGATCVCAFLHAKSPREQQAHLRHTAGTLGDTSSTRWEHFRRGDGCAFLHAQIAQGTRRHTSDTPLAQRHLRDTPDAPTLGPPSGGIFLFYLD